MRSISRRHVRGPVLAAALLPWSIGPGPVLGQAPEPGSYSPESYEVTSSLGHPVPMRDGVRLSVDLVRPKTTGTFPVILSHTPYSNNSPGLRARAEWFARRGYVVALSDVRGRYDSEGVWDPFDPKHKTDGYDLVQWLAVQPWSSSQVGMIGASFVGWTQWWTATQAPPALKAIVPEVAPPDQFFNCPYQQGVLVGWTMDWACAQAGRTIQVVGSGPYAGFTLTRAQDLMSLPYIELDDRRGMMNAPWFDRWISQNLATDPYWKAIAYQTEESYSNTAVASLGVTGWFDANYPGTPRNYLAMKEHGATDAARRPHIVIGPWPHTFNSTRQLAGIDYGPQALLDWDGYACRWLDHFLKGIDNGAERDPPVHVFVMGRNRWRAAADWPIPGTSWTRYYFHSQGKADSLAGDGLLSTEPPGDEPPDPYAYDPADPTPSPFTGGHIDGAVDTRASAARKDVLVYSTAPLEEEVEVIGPMTAQLFAATSARDTDWMVRLVDVQPDGRSLLLCDGVLRARCRNPDRNGAFDPTRLSTIEPRTVYEYTIEFWRGTGNVFAKGHRIRVELSSSFHPYYLRNPNTGADNIGLEIKAVIAHQTVHHDREHPSHIVLPIIRTPQPP